MLQYIANTLYLFTFGIGSLQHQLSKFSYRVYCINVYVERSPYTKGSLLIIYSLQYKVFTELWKSCYLFCFAALLQQARQEMDLAIEKLERQNENLKQKMQSIEKELHLIIQQKEQTHEEDVERLVRERVSCGHFSQLPNLYHALVKCY